MKISTKLVSLLFITLSFFVIHYSLALKAYAANAVPPPTVPCLQDDPNAIDNPEFNSLRPYQGSPCRDAPLAVMCGNRVKILLDHVSTNYNPLTCDNQSCPPLAQDSGVITKRVQIDLSDAKLPILGNTQETANSQNPTDTFDDAQKVNEYAAWYLAGTNQKAEYGQDTISDVVDFSGPQKKLLPSAIAEFERFQALHNGTVDNPVTLDEDANEGVVGDPNPYEDENDTIAGIQTDQTANHNQIVVCTSNDLPVSILGLEFSIPWIGEEKPIPCYDEGGTDKANGTEYRLSDWWESKYAGVIESRNVIEDWDGSQSWNYAVPPFPWQFEKDIYYQKAYNEWRGKNCLIILDKLVCVDIHIPGTVFDISTNKWANLYQYVPLSNSVDKRGKESYTSVHVSASDAEIVRYQKDSSIEGTIITSNPKLFYPHTIGVSEALDNLNSTYLPQDGVSYDINPESTEVRPTDIDSNCQILDVRTNPGDDMTFEQTRAQDKHLMDFTVFYRIESIDCTLQGETDPVILPVPATPIPPQPIYDCSSDIYAEVQLTTESPYLQDIYEKSTSGAASTFRRIFPKVEEGAPVSCIADIPGASNIGFNIRPGLTSPGVSILQVLNPGNKPGSPTQVYFPHLGSVYEYFLKGIQTALRPKGYGGPITEGELCEPLEGVGTCKQWLLDEAVYNKVIAAAASTTCNGRSLNPFWAIGIGLNENGGLMTDSADGSSSSHFGCNVSEVQSIDEKISCMTNTLRNDCLAGKTDEQALQEYGYPAGYVLWPITVLNPGGAYPPPLFGSGFNTNQLITNLINTDWQAAYESQVPIFCPNSPVLEPT